ncbi:MAG: hypothetical protein NZZ41_01770 [Candidatus Dojkabacteria bacterium]|nr:hypothetical protein [Candidatus Dojkabacteria bacterium]
MKKVWRLWAKALGEKASPDNTEADIIAFIRTMLVLLNIITNIFIICGVIRHWGG